jgi:flagellar basal-body rod protein FlgF
VIRGFYAAATALDAASQRQEVTAHNLAHASDPGYRQRGTVHATFDEVLNHATPPAGDLNGTRIVKTYSDFKSGPVIKTENPLDVAIETDAFFTFTGPNGPLFSRNGTFRMTSDGQLLSQGGYPVTGADGPITIPPGTASISISREGTVQADGLPVGKLLLARFDRPEQLTSVGPTLYRAPQDAGIQFVEQGVIQGFRESSNVNTPLAMVDLIQESRYFDASQRALRAIAESIGLNTKPQ